MTNQFPGTFPVIAERDGRLYGYVFQAPSEPDTPVTAVTAVTWTYARALTGEVAAARHVSRRAATLALLIDCGVAKPDLLTIADLDLVGVLHGLSERYTGRQILRAALDYALSCNTPLPDDTPILDDPPGAGGDAVPMDRVLVRQVITGHIGPWTADDVFALYDKVAPERVPLAAVTD